MTEEHEVAVQNTQDSTGTMMNSTIEVKPTLAGEELREFIIESVRKLFEEDSKYFIDGYIEHVAKEKVGA